MPIGVPFGENQNILEYRSEVRIPERRIYMNEVKKRIHYDCVETKEDGDRRQGGKGQGITAAILDTGVSAHPDLAGRVTFFQDFINGRIGAYDDCAHGTHVAGILAGDGRMSKGRYAGMAPECKICMLKVLDGQGKGSVEHFLTGIDWILKNYQKYQIQLVNLSVGMPEGENERREKTLTEAVEEMWNTGLTVVVSAGNAGPKAGTIAVPGTSRKVITVGASENGLIKEAYSGRGPTRECVIKPDVTAPGTRVVSCNAWYGHRNAPAYIRKSGTSMATPVVSGAAALLLSRWRDMTNVEIKLRMIQSSDIGKNGEACGRLNVKQLLSYAWQ